MEPQAVDGSGPAQVPPGLLDLDDVTGAAGAAGEDVLAQRLPRMLTGVALADVGQQRPCRRAQRHDVVGPLLGRAARFAPYAGGEIEIGPAHASHFSSAP